MAGWLFCLPFLLTCLFTPTGNDNSIVSFLELDGTVVSMCEHHVDVQRNRELEQSLSIDGDYDNVKTCEVAEITGEQNLTYWLHC